MTSGQPYAWKRFWIPRDHPSIGDDPLGLWEEGYFPDPDSQYWWVVGTSGIAPLEQIVSVPCLVLLGEPGMGKTSTLEDAQAAIDQQVNEAGGETVWLRLRSYTTDQTLKADLFDSDKFSRWKSGDHQLHIFLDDFD